MPNSTLPKFSPGRIATVLLLLIPVIVFFFNRDSNQSISSTESHFNVKKANNGSTGSLDESKTVEEKKHYEIKAKRGVVAGSVDTLDEGREPETALYMQNINRIEIDQYGNQYADISVEGSGITKYLISNSPLLYPDTQERAEDGVNGCMSLNYYVNYDAYIALVVYEDGLLRTHYSQCSYDDKFHKYYLENKDQPPADIRDGINLLISQLI